MQDYEVRAEIPEDIREELKEYSDLLAHLLFHRGIQTKKSAKEFFTHEYSSLHNPFLFKDIDKAIDRILKAISENERICIYADYDADGIPAAVILSDFFDKIGFENYFVYIPHRNKEGFGLNNKAVETIKEKGAKLIITVDCGIADVDQVKLANELGMEVIITDHHETNGVLPEAYAIVNPKQDGCQYPEKMLCGSAVVFKLVQALISKGDFDLPDNWEKTLLDMVGIATLSDMVPLLGENRKLASFGLTVLRMSPRTGFQLLLKKNRVDQQKISEDDVGFTISPRINAASRMDEPELAFQMLKEKDHGKAGALVDHLQKINDQRKGHVAAMVKEAKHKAEEKTDTPVLVMGNTKWQPSLLGLAASSLSDEYKKPVFLWGRGEGTDLKGSCRTPDVSVVDILAKLPETILETWGGHHQAGGFVVKKDAVDFLEEEIVKVYKSLDAETKDHTKFADKTLSLSEINENLFQEIQKLSPFGQDNQQPVFIFRDVNISATKEFGKRKEHISLFVSSDDLKPREAIAFFKTKDSWNKKIEVGETIGLVATIEKNNFGRNNGLRLRIVDVL